MFFFWFDTSTLLLTVCTETTSVWLQLQIVFFKFGTKTTSVWLHVQMFFFEALMPIWLRCGNTTPFYVVGTQRYQIQAHIQIKVCQNSFLLRVLENTIILNQAQNA